MRSWILECSHSRLEQCRSSLLFPSPQGCLSLLPSLPSLRALSLQESAPAGLGRRPGSALQPSLVGPGKSLSAPDSSGSSWQACMQLHAASAHQEAPK